MFLMLSVTYFSDSSMKLYVSTKEAILSMEYDGRSMKKILLVDAVDMDFDIDKDILFYINRTDMQVYMRFA